MWSESDILSRPNWTNRNQLWSQPLTWSVDQAEEAL
jgi:hypothetical protein